MPFLNKPIHLGTLQIRSFFLFKDQPLALCFHIENYLQMKRCQRGFLLPKQTLPTSIYKRWFIKNTQEKHFELLINRQRWLRTNSFII
ncbi:protein ycf2 [Phtheirospermum japonicum]|uniref:Protein ycf2 n=1 Tax=Phtheirospermum japonicum TaxID=374723 RepID=A0A830BUY0_9LAMI|nr:protein ycf2 [Phtheirospermum japonicum]